MKPEDPRRPSGQMLPQSVETNGYFTRLRDSQEWRAIGLVLRRSTERPQVYEVGASINPIPPAAALTRRFRS